MRSLVFGLWSDQRLKTRDQRPRGVPEMGEIVAAVGTCHTPYMFTRPPDEDPQQLEQAGAAMQELGKVLDETKPDVILFFGADHVETFSVTCVPSFAIVAGNRAIAKFAGREHDLP